MAHIFKNWFLCASQYVVRFLWKSVYLYAFTLKVLEESPRTFLSCKAQYEQTWNNPKRDIIVFMAFEHCIRIGRSKYKKRFGCQTIAVIWYWIPLVSASKLLHIPHISTLSYWIFCILWCVNCSCLMLRAMQAHVYPRLPSNFSI